MSAKMWGPFAPGARDPDSKANGSPLHPKERLCRKCRQIAKHVRFFSPESDLIPGSYQDTSATGTAFAGLSAALLLLESKMGNTMRVVTALSSSSSQPPESVQFHQALARDLRGELTGMVRISRFEARSGPSWIHNGIFHSLKQHTPLRSARSADEFYAWQGLPVLSFPSLNDASLARWLRKSGATVVLCIDLWEAPKIDILTSVDLVARVTLSQDSLRSYAPRLPLLKGIWPNPKNAIDPLRDTLRIRGLTPVAHDLTPLLDLELPTARGSGYGLAGTMTAAYLNGVYRAEKLPRGDEQSGLTDDPCSAQLVVNQP